MKKSIQIGVFSPNHDDASSWYRCAGPLAHLRRYPHSDQAREIQPFFMRAESASWSNMAGLDLVMLHRPHRPADLAVAQLARQLKIPVWVDHDDDFTSVPTDNPASAYVGTAGVQEVVRKVLLMADHVTVTTAFLGERLVTLCGKPGQDDPFHPIVIPNALDETLFPQMSESPRAQIVLWRGSQTHQRDLLSVTDAFLWLSKSTKWKTVFLGYNPWQITERMPAGSWTVVDWSSLMQFFKTVGGLAPSLAFVPLDRTIFNKSKSNIAHLEATAAGALTVAPNTFVEFKAPGVLGYNTARDSTDATTSTDARAVLEDAVRLCEEEPGLVKHQKDLAWEWIQKERTLKAVNYARRHLIERLV